MRDRAGLEVRLGEHRGEVSLPVRVLPSPPAPDFYLSLSPSGVALRPGEGWPGGREVAQVAVGRQGGFSLPVSLSAEASPPFAPLSPSLPEGGIGYRLQGEGDLWTLHLAVGPRVPPGAYTLTLRGSAGDRVRTASLTLTVGEAGFSLSLEPTGLTVQPGGSATATLTLTPQGGFTGTVALSLVGAPQGVSPVSYTHL
ncbi:MAG: hypothetical protein N2324_13150, partial [Thermus sp.]|nr:hypothetical protein [Thermus sp.]